MRVYFDDGQIRIRSMLPEDAKVLYDTYLSYGWHPRIEVYENYYREQEDGKRLVFIAVYLGRVSGHWCLIQMKAPGAVKAFPRYRT